MSDDDKTEEDKLIELQNYFNRIRRGRTKRTLQQPTTDYGYLNSYLANNIDIYVAGFDYIGEEISGEYARKLKEKLASKKIVGVKDLDNFGDPQPKKIIVFEDGSEETVPMQLIEEADAQQQQKIDFMARTDTSQEGRINPMELQQSQTLVQPTTIAPKIENIIDGKYAYQLVDGEPTRITDRESGVSDFEITPEARKIILEKYKAIRGQSSPPATSISTPLPPPITTSISTPPTIPSSPQIESSVPVSQPYDMRQDIQPPFDMFLPYEQTGLYDIRQDVSLEDLSETIKKDDPSELKELGEKVKKGYEGLSKEQKAMGLLTGLDVAGEVVNYFGPARREGRRRLGELEERRERGQLGVDERQDAETMKYMTRPVRAMAEESEREQQAVMAGMGETRSAADLRRLRESRDAQMTDALSRAGQEVARQQMARKEMEKRELNQLQAYQQENLRNLTNRISGAAAQMAGTFGANVAAEADIQRELDPEMMERKIQLLIGQGMSPEEARRKVQAQAIENARLFTGLRG